MLSGIREIIIIGCVLIGLFLLPRLLRVRKGSADAGPMGAAKKSNDGIMRLALLLTGLWIALALILLTPLEGGLLPFFAAGVLPVALGWGIRWVVLGFK